MLSFTHHSRIRLYSRLSRVLAFGGLGVMGVAVLLSLRQPYPVDLVFGLLLVGMLASQIGLPLRNRWDREPRFDQVLDEHLKGLDKRYLLFHHYLGASHVLICPAGVFALIPRLEEGEIEYLDGKWQRTVEKGGFLRRGGVKPIRGLDRDASASAERAQRRLSRLGTPVEIQPMLVFLHHAAQVNVNGAPFQCAHVKKLKPALRKLPKGETLTNEQVDGMLHELGLEA